MKYITEETLKKTKTMKHNIILINNLFREFIEKIKPFTVPSDIVEEIVSNNTWYHEITPAAIIDKRFSWIGKSNFQYNEFWRLQIVFVIFILCRNIHFDKALYSMTNQEFLERLFILYNNDNELKILKYKIFQCFKKIFIRKHIWDKEKIKYIENTLAMHYKDAQSSHPIFLY
jgi:hypothetical protein